MKTPVIKRWIKIDAATKKVGRLATSVAFTLQGKDLPTYSPNQPVGTHIVVINCADAVYTEKRLQEELHHHTGYIGNLKSKKRSEIPMNEQVQRAILGMLPKNRTRRVLAKHLHCFETEQHPYKSEFKQDE